MELHDAHKQSSLSRGTRARRRKVEACAVLQHHWGGGARKTLTRVPHRGQSPAWEAPFTSRPQFPLLSPSSLRLFCLDPLRDLGRRGAQLVAGDTGDWGAPVLLGVEGALASFLLDSDFCSWLPLGVHRKPGPEPHRPPWEGEETPPDQHAGDNGGGQGGQCGHPGPALHGLVVHPADERRRPKR